MAKIFINFDKPFYKNARFCKMVARKYVSCYKIGHFCNIIYIQAEKSRQKICRLNSFYYFAMSCAILLATAAGSSGIMPSMSSACAYKRLQ